MTETNCPMLEVDDIIIELKHLSSLCNMLSQVRGEHTLVSFEVVGDTMMLIRDCLDQQINALDGIHWNPATQ